MVIIAKVKGKEYQFIEEKQNHKLSTVIGGIITVDYTKGGNYV